MEQSKRVAVSAKDDFKNNVFGEHHGQHHCSSHLALGAAPPSHAGPVTATGFLRSAKIGDPKANVAQAATVTDMSRKTVGVRFEGGKKFRCSLTWD